GKFWEERVHPEDRERVVSGIDRALAGTNSEWSDEYRFLRQDGAYAHVQDKGHILRDAAGKALRMIGGISDFTERARAEEALRESESRFREMAENIKDVFYNFDAATGRVLYISPSYAEIWGRPVSNVYESAGDYLEGIHPADRESLLRTYGSHVPTETEYRVVRPNGDISWVLGKAFPILNHGKVERIVGTVRDITDGKRVLEALRESERHLTNVLDNLPGMAYRCLLNSNWTMRFVSEGALALTGYHSDELVDNALVSFGSLIRREDRDRILNTASRPAMARRSAYGSGGVFSRTERAQRVTSRASSWMSRPGKTPRRIAKGSRPRLTSWPRS
ncbi:MAG: multi-sensor signal transduction histidine kinase, partial [Fibrobacteria bacterium]|nr:multi-sensor signal transduction histidine kinase [Fibrobacteria bacterium]